MFLISIELDWVCFGSEPGSNMASNTSPSPAPISHIQFNLVFRYEQMKLYVIAGKKITQESRTHPYGGKKRFIHILNCYTFLHGAECKIV